MTKKIFIIIIIFLLFIGGVSILIYPLFKVPDFIIYAQNNNLVTIENGDIIGGYNNGLNFESFNKKYYSRYEFVYTNYDPLNPTITFISERIKTKSIDFEIYKLQRKNFFEYEIYSRRFGYTRDYTYEQTLELAKKQNLAENNPDSKNIIVEKLKETSKNNEEDKILKEMPENIKFRLNNLSLSNQGKFIKYYVMQKYTQQYTQKDVENYLSELEKNNIPDTFDSAENIFNQHR